MDKKIFSSFRRTKSLFSKKHAILTSFAVLMMSSAMSQNFTAVAPSGQTLYYTISNGVAMVTSENTSSPRYTSLAGALVIPDSVTYNDTTYAVGRINSSAFFGCSQLTSVTIPAPITNIGNVAFRNCTALTTVNFNADSCLQMGAGSNTVFNGCTALTTVNIGINVKNIPNNAFANCSTLTTITIPNAVKNIGTSAFSNCSGLTSLSIGDGTSSISYNAFSGCSNLSSIVVSSGNTVYDSRDNCNAIITTATNYLLVGGNNTTIPISVTRIESNAFQGRTGITSITIPPAVTMIGSNAFGNCTNLTTVNFNADSCTQMSSVFNGCTSFTTLNIGQNVKSIPNTAFNNCRQLTTVNFNADSCTHMGGQNAYAVFVGDTSFTSLNIGNNVKIIPNNAFEGCTKIQSITIPSSVATIGTRTFANCTTPQIVAIPSTVTSIGTNAFLNVNLITYTGTATGSPWGAKGILDGDFVYTDTTKTTLKEYIGSGTAVTIPSTVVTIGGNAFDSCTHVTSVIIPTSVTTISSFAFRSCTGLTSVTIPQSVSSVGNGAFKDCTALTTVNFNANNCTTMGTTMQNNIFSGCTAFTTLNIGSNVKRIPNYAFANCSSITSITIPDSVSYIGSAAFGNCTSLTTVNFNADSCITSNSSSSIFSGCTSITTLNIGPNVKLIPNYAFEYCAGITSLTLPNSVKNIGSYAFRGCSGITSLTLSNSVKIIGSYAFLGCTGITSITIPQAVTSIGSGVFAYCSGLTTVNFNADSCTSMGSNSSLPVFDSCPAFTTLNIGNNVKRIPAFAFRGCSELTSVTIPDAVTSIGSAAFENCSGLTSFTIGSGVQEIQGTFTGCTSMASIVISGGNTVYDSRDNCNAIIETASNTLIYGCKNTVIPATVTTIGTSAFYGCTGLTSITIPQAVTFIRNNAFNGCTGLTTLNFNADSCAIQNNTGFSSCTALTTVNIGPTVRILSTGIFRNCTSITTVNFNADSCMLQDNYKPFSACTALTTANIGSNVKYIPDNLFYNCYNISSLSIPSSVTCIGSNAFYNCTGFPSVTIPNSVDTIGPNAFYNVYHIEYYGTATGARWGARSMNGLIDGDFVYADSTKTYLMLYLGSDTAVTIPYGVDSIAGAFRGNTTLKSVTIPATVTYLGETFRGCTNLRSIVCDATVPPTCYWTFQNVPYDDVEVHVPCLSRQAYLNANATYGWTILQTISNQSYCIPPIITVESNDTTLGSVESNIYNDTATLYAYPKTLCRFDHWNDGNTDNPRTIIPSGDTLFTAFFAPRDTAYVTDTLIIARETVWVEGTNIINRSVSYSPHTTTPTFDTANQAQTAIAIQPLVSIGDRTFIPDGPSCPGDKCYTSGNIVSGYPAGRQIQSPEDILSVCINMEHSFMGDFEISLLCPSYSPNDTTGHGIAVLKYQSQGDIPQGIQVPNGTYGGSGRYLGIPYGGSSIYDRMNGGDNCDSIYNPYGYGFDYCFSRNHNRTLVNGQPADTPFPENAGLANVSPVTVTHFFPPIPAGFTATGQSCDTVTVNTLPASNREEGTGFYLPASDFTSLVGCPLNGEWQIKICDKYARDNGWIFNWSLDFGSNVYIYTQDSALGSVRTNSTNTGLQVAALPKAGIYFLGWDNGVEDNPYTPLVYSDTSLVALFDRHGITIHDTVDTVWISDTIYQLPQPPIPNNWNQAAACPGWNNPTAFTSGNANNYYRGQLGDRPNQAFDVMTGNTGMTWSGTILTASQMQTVTASSCSNLSSSGGVLPDNQKQFAIMTTQSQVSGHMANRDPNTADHLPFVPTQFNTNSNNYINTNLTRSIRIGDACANSGNGTNQDNAGASALYYNTRVTTQNALMYIYYAVVVQAPGHGKDVDPVFCIRATRQSPTGGWAQVSDTLAYYVSSTPAPNQGITVSGNGGYGDVTLAPNYNTNGWHSNGGAGDNRVFYKDWSKVMLNLSDYMYENIRIEIMISDCAYNAHWAYAYVAGECRPMYISSQGCPAGMSTDVATLMAPLGMSHYQWSASNMGVSDPVTRLNPGAGNDWFTFRDLTNPLTEAQGGYIYNVQASDFKVNYRPNQSHALIQPTDSLGQVVDSFGNSQTFRCRMTSALDPDKPYSSDLYINVTNTKPTMQIDSLAFCDGNVRLWNRSYVPGNSGLVVDSNTMWWMYSDPACTGTLLDTLRGDSINYNFGDTNLHGFIVRSMTLDSNCYSDAKYTIKPPSKYTSDTSATAAGHFLWHGTDYNASGDYPDTLTSHEGCDSIVTLHLTITTDTHAYVNMGDGLLWATCNVGADNPWDTGGYFAWGETYTKDTYNWSTYSFSRNGSSTNFTRYTGSDYSTLIPEDDAATVNWGGEWRMPTDEEWTALRNTTNYSWVWQTNYNGTGAEGMLVTRLTGPCAGNSIFLPKAGAMNPNGFLFGGLYWSSTIVQGNRDRAWSIAFSNIDVQRSTRYRMYGKSVRAVRPVPTYTVAAASGNDTMGSAGVLVVTPGAPAATTEPSMNVEYGETVNLSATPNQGYHFVCWMEDSILYSRTADTAATIFGNRSFTALFAPDMADIVLTNLSCSIVGNRLKIEYQYANQGEVDYTTTVGISVYRNHYRGEVVGGAPLMYSDDDMLASSGNIETRSYLYGRMIICRLEPEDSLVVAINDMGLGVARHANAQPESDTLNNIAVLHINGVFPDRHVYSVDEQAVCDSLTWIDDSTYRASTDTAYYTAVSNYQGSRCDSVIRLDLTVSHSTASDTVAVVCDSMQWHGQTYTANAEPVLLLQAANADGCDSTVTLHLTINHSSSRDTTAAAINSFAWNGTTYTASGDYTDSLTSVGGCDSTETLHLTITNLDTITLMVNDTSMGSISLQGAFIPRDTVDLSTIHSDYTVQDGTVLTGTLGGNHKISISAGASVMLKGVTINRIEQNNNNPRPGQGGNQSTPTYLWAGLSLMGDATIVLEDSNYVKGFNSRYPGIHVPAGSTLTIRGEGILTASPGEKTSLPYFEASAIGGGYLISNGNIVIESGTIHAHGNYAAGIGGGYGAINPRRTCGNITIRGGNIDASSIGCGDSETIDSITITGGTVVATGNDFEAGIGSGNFGTVNHIIITGGTVIAQGGVSSTGIGGAANGHCGEVVIDSTVVLVTSAAGRNCTTHIGAGTWSTVDTVIVAGQGYTDLTAPFSYTGNGVQNNFMQPTAIDLGGNSYLMPRGKRVVVQATPKVDYHLAEWSDGTAVNAAGTDTLTVNGSMLLTAIFAHDPYYIGVAVMDTSMGSAMVVYNDSVASRLPVEPDSVCTITATPKFGYHFVRWEEAGSLYSRTADTSVTAASNRFFYAVFERTYDTITLAVNDTSMGSIALQGATFTATDTVNLDTIQSDYTVQDGTVLTGTLGGIYKISVAAGASVMLSDMDITGVHNDNYTWAGLNLLGDATIVINDNTTNYIRGFHQHYPGIHVPVGATLTIRGNGELTASSGHDPNQSYPMRAAGIGGGYNVPSGSIVIESGTIITQGAYGASLGGGFNDRGTACGNIAIHGGTVSATSIGCGNRGIIDTILITGGTITASAYSNQAGIGSDAFGTVNNIIITGGTVNVTGGPYAAGIGGGNYATVNHITITGGTITATGGDNGAGIGTGPGRSNEGVCGDITIATSVTSVTAIKGDGNTQNIGSGSGGTCGTITVGGQPYTDNPNASSYTFVGDGSAPQNNSTQPMIIGLGGNSYRIARGTTVNISAIPNSIYYRLANWTEADTVYSRTADTAVTITPNRTLTAVFESNLQHITVNSSEGGNGHVAAACENFDSYTVGNHVAAEAIAHGNNCWTTWYRAPGTDADGTIANINGSNCAHFVRGNDEVMLFGDIADGVYELEFDLMVPNGKDGYFNVLHHFDGSSSHYAIETYLHLYREYNLTKTPTPGFGDVYAGQEHAAVMPCVYDTWMHFRVHVDLDNDTAQLYYSLPGEVDSLIYGWRWVRTSTGGYSPYHTLSAVDFFPAYSDSTSEFYVDNIVLNRSNNNYPRGTQCNLTATPDEHYHFVCWMEADTVYSRSADTVINVTGDRTFTALFAIDQHYIATACNDTSMGSTSVEIGGAPSQGNSTFAVADYGTTATITATPKFGYHFVRWEEDTSLYSRAADTTVDVTADRYFYAVFERTYDTITLMVNDTSMGSIALHGAFTPTDTVNLDTIQGDYTVQDGTVLTGTLGGNYKISVAAGASVMLNNMNITGVHDSSYMWAGLSLLGDATIVLEDSTTNYIKGFFFKYPGIHVPVGATLTIRGDGELTAESGKNENASNRWMAAGIGGGYDVPSGSIVIENGIITTLGGYGASLGGGYNTQRRACGNIAIHGGTISATCIGGGYNALIDSVLITGGSITARASVNQPGIGCDGSGILNHLIITGGTINATGGSNGAGIGCGRTTTVNHITITGGTITAKGGNLAAGIGSGSYNGHCGEIVIASSVTSVTAIKGNGSTQNIGSGESGTCDTVIVGGQPYTDDPNASSYTFVGDGSTPSSNIPQPSVIAIGDNIYRIARGTTVVVQATPKPGHHLAEWSDGTAVNTDNTDTLMVNGSLWLMAIFEQNPYLISAASADTAMGSAVVIYNDSVASTQPVEPGATFFLEATAKPCYHFVCWTKGADTVASESIIELSATDTCIFMAHFERNLPLLGDTTAVACDQFPWYGSILTASDTVTHDLFTAEGCDSTVTLRLTVNYSSTGDTTAVVCDSMTWYNTTFTSTPVTHMPTHVFTNAVGCDSTLNLHLTVNHSTTGDTTAVACDVFSWYNYDTITASTDTLTTLFEAANQWGCDSTVTLHLTVNYKNTGDTTAVECDQFSWYEHTGLTASADSLTHLFQGGNQWGCDSTVTLHLTVNYQNTGDTTAVECDQFSWYEHMRLTSSVDTLTHLFQGGNRWGCDSTVTLHLTVNYQNTGDTTAVACDQFSWYEHQNLTASSNNLTHLFQDGNQWGCDSTVTLNLTINYKNTGDTTAVECDQFSWYEHTSLTASIDTLKHLFQGGNQWGCDSTVTLNLTVHYQNTGDTTAVVCDSLRWYGTNYTASATPTHLFANQWGCDSTVTLNLTVKYSSTSDTSAVECDQFAWSGATYTASGDPERHYTNAVGCDSTRTLHLTINYQNTGDTTAVECDQFSWYEHQNLTASSNNLTHLFQGGNQWGCDSTVTLHLTVNYKNTGDTTAVACDQFSWYEHTGLTTSVDTLKHLFQGGNRWGCDSTVTLHLTVNYQNTGDTTAVACDHFSWYQYNNITSSSNNRTHRFVGANQWGCDSTVTLHLTVNYQNTGDTTAVECDHFSWYEHQNLTTSSNNKTHRFIGANRWGCDSTVTLHLTVHYQNTGDTNAVTYEPYSWYEHTNMGSTQNVQHTFPGANRWGCDSTVTLHLRYALFSTTWTGATTVTYNSQPQNVISATYVDDTGHTKQVALTFTNGTETITTPNYPVNAGVWAVVARPLRPVDSLSGATATLTILPATVSVTGAEVEIAKVYDGTTIAQVLNQGTLNNIQGNDPLTHITTADFNDAEVGQNKTITLNYALQGSAELLGNYVLERTSEVYSTSGAIVDPILPDPQHTFDLAAYGYCSGTDEIGYHLVSGAPDQYKIDFADSRFTDVDWTDLATPGLSGTIPIEVPEDLPMGDYSLTVTFRNSQYTWIESDALSVTIHVNLPSSYTRPLFYNVIILIDTCECFTDVQWYHRASGGQWEAIPGANDYNYREVGGLTGEYFVRVKMNGVETYTCPQGNLTSLVEDEDEQQETTLTAYPNPASASTTVSIEHSPLDTHVLRVMNTVGVEMERRTFSGTTTNIDLSSWERGTYIVSVDGMIVRIVKN